MAIQTTYSNARTNLASLLDRVTDEQEIVVISRRGHEDVAMVSAAELSSMMETEYLFRSPKNAKRLISAMKQVRAGGGETTTIEALRKEFGAEKPKNKTKP